MNQLLIVPFIEHAACCKGLYFSPTMLKVATSDIIIGTGEGVAVGDRALNRSLITTDRGRSEEPLRVVERRNQVEIDRPEPLAAVAIDKVLILNIIVAMIPAVLLEESNNAVMRQETAGLGAVHEHMLFPFLIVVFEHWVPHTERASNSTIGASLASMH